MVLHGSPPTRLLKAEIIVFGLAQIEVGVTVERFDPYVEAFNKFNPIFELEVSH